VAKTKTQDQLIVIYNGKTFIDQYGADVSIQVTAQKQKALIRRGGALRRVSTAAGGYQWRHADKSVYDAIATTAQPLDVVDNRVDEVQIDIEQYLQNSVSLRPTNLILSDLKWKYLMRSVVRGKNIMMTGPSGCGKTLAVQSVAKALNGRPFYYFNFGATTDARSTLIGNTHYSKENGTYVAEALFAQAVQVENAIIMMDELTRATPDAWNILITVLDENQRYLRIDERPDTPTINVAKGVTFIATANIGAEYTATRVLDRAILDRFTAIVEMEPLSQTEEISLLKMTYPNLNDESINAIANIAHTTRVQVKSDDPKVTTSMSSRLTVEMAGLMYDGFSLADAAEVCIYPFFSDAGGTDSERTFMKQLVQKFIPTAQTSSAPWVKPQAAPL
jgi:MoxR-like ATPase